MLQLYVYIPKGVFPLLKDEELNELGHALHEVVANYQLKKQVSRTSAVPLMSEPELFTITDVSNGILSFASAYDALNQHGSNLEASDAAHYMLVLAIMWAVLKNTKVENFSNVLNRRFDSLVRFANLPPSSVIFPANWVNQYRSVQGHFKNILLTYAKEFFSARAEGESESHHRMRSYMAIMLGGHEMAGYTAMVDLIETTDRRQAHVSIHVLKDIIKFNDVRNHVEAEAKNLNYPVGAFKIMNPDTTLLQNSNFPNLHFCAV